MCSKTHKTRFIFILQKCSIICMHGSDYCYPSTSLDQDLELGGGLSQRSHRVENCSSRLVPLLLEPGTAESRMGWWNSSRQRLPTSASSHSCASSAPQNCDSRSPLESGLFASVCMATHQIRPQ